MRGCLSRAERREVQQRLIERGYDIGQPDGMIGARTRTAIESFQQAAGLAVDGRAGVRVLRGLQAPTPVQENPASESNEPPVE